MIIKDLPYELIDWQNEEKTEVKGLTSNLFQKTKKYNDLRIRLIEKMPGYRADHFCKKGHVIYIIEGSMVVEFENGENVTVSGGQSILLSDDHEFGHSTYSEKGVKYFIID